MREKLESFVTEYKRNDLNKENKSKAKWEYGEGITLIALVVMIVVLLILAGISISMLSGDESIIKNAQNAKTETERAELEEKIRILIVKSYDSKGDFDAEKFKKELDKLGVTYTETESEITIEIPNGKPIIVSKETGEIIEETHEDVQKIVYIVEHYQMDVKGDYPSDPTERDAYTDGTVGATITLASLKKDYEGFEYIKGQVNGVDETTITVLEDGSRVIKLYYERNQYTLTFNGNGGSTPLAITTYHGAGISLQNSTREGYAFNGWFTSESGGTKVNYTTMPINGGTLYAQWTSTDLSGKALSVGQEVTVGGEQFFVIKESTASDENVTLLAKFNLNKAGTTQVNVSSYTETACVFSSSVYWSKDGEDLNNSKAPSGSAYKKAVNYGLTKGGKGRLLTKSEATQLGSTAPDIACMKNYGYLSEGSTGYWLGTCDYYLSTGTAVCYYRISDGKVWYSKPDTANFYSLRPVLEISKSKVTLTAEGAEVP